MDGDAVRTAAAVMGATGVTIGAFGAHALKATLTERKTLASFQTGVQVRRASGCIFAHYCRGAWSVAWSAGAAAAAAAAGLPESARSAPYLALPPRMCECDSSGAQYHLLHAAALLALSAVADASKRDVDTTAKCWIGGVVLFSGSICEFGLASVFPHIALKAFRSHGRACWLLAAVADGLSLGGPRILGPVTPLVRLLPDAPHPGSLGPIACPCPLYMPGPAICRHV